MPRLHHQARRMGRRRLQRRCLANRLRRTCALGEICLWLQPATFQPHNLLANPCTIHQIIRPLLGLECALDDENHNYQLCRYILRHRRRLDHDDGKLLRHRLVQWISRQILHRQLESLVLNRHRLQRAR